MSITITNQQNQLNQAAGVSSDDESRSPKTQLGQEDFLQLLTVQLQNQDPLNPQSDMDFIASMSSFSSVEAMGSLSTNFETFMTNQGELNQTMLETLTQLSESMSNSEAIQTQLTAQAYLGKEVTIVDPDKGEFTGVVERVELIEQNNIDGTTEQIVGLVVNDEIFPVDLVTSVKNYEEEGVLSTLGNVASTVAKGALSVL